MRDLLSPLELAIPRVGLEQLKFRLECDRDPFGHWKSFDKKIGVGAILVPFDQYRMLLMSSRSFGPAISLVRTSAILNRPSSQAIRTIEAAMASRVRW
jgi:hypothetical protein